MSLEKELRRFPNQAVRRRDETNEGLVMNKRGSRSRDDLAVFLSLATAVVILISAAGGMWVWSIVSEMPMAVTVEKDPDAP